jgi:hypothetical protein
MRCAKLQADIRSYGAFFMSAKYLPVAKAIESETGIRPNPVTCWRWYTKGCGGVLLQTKMIGGRRYTTLDLVREFISTRTGNTTSISSVKAQLNQELGL